MWHIPIIPVTREPESGRSQIQGQSQQLKETVSKSN